MLSIFVKKTKKGLSLIEIVFFITIVSFISGAIVNMILFSAINFRNKQTKDTISIINTAIKDYVDKYGVLPCAASFLDTINDASYGSAINCKQALSSSNGVFVSGTNDDVIVHGSVPFKTLGLSEKYAYDSWGRRIRYVVIKKLAMSSDDLMNYKTSDPIDTIKVFEDEKKSSHISEIGYLLISHGKRKAGSYDRSGVLIQCPPSVVDGYNCDNDSEFYFIPQNYSNNNNYYDDILYWVTIPSIKEYIINSSGNSNYYVKKYCNVGDVIMSGSLNSSVNDKYLILNSDAAMSAVINDDSRLAVVVKESQNIKYLGKCANKDIVITEQSGEFIIKDGVLFFNFDKKMIYFVNDIVDSIPQKQGLYIANFFLSDYNSGDIEKNSIFFVDHNGIIYNAHKPDDGDIVVVTEKKYSVYLYNNNIWDVKK